MQAGELVLDTVLEVACKAADEARRLIAQAGEGPLSPAFKSDGSPVTALDKAIESAIRAEIVKAFPEHAIQGEEHPDRLGSARYEWVIDPIDGTIALLHRIPTFATLIALCERGLPVASVVDLPALQERYTAVRGRGAYSGRKRLTVAESFDWDASIVCHGDRYTFEGPGYGALYHAVAERARFFRSYTDAFGHTLAARGAAALMIDAGMQPWDLAAPMLLVEEAGGKVALYRDRQQPRRFLGLCGNPRAVEAVQELAASLGFQPVPEGDVHLTAP